MDKKEIVRYNIKNADEYGMKVNFHIHCGEYPTKHTHSYWEIMIMTDKSVVSVVNDKKYLLSVNDIQILRPNDEHLVKKVYGQAHTNINLEVDSEFLKSFLDSFETGLYERLLTRAESTVFRCDNAEIKKYKEYIHRTQLISFPYGPERQILLKQLVMDVVLTAVRKAVETADDKTDALCGQFIACMKAEENISSGLDEICKKLNYNEEYVIRHFKKILSDTPNNFFRRIKLEYACGLLNSTDITIVRVAEKVGFGSVGYFNRIFRAKYDLSPNEYRKQHKRDRFVKTF
jgi:AraC-like DNA-binding protein